MSTNLANFSSNNFPTAGGPFTSIVNAIAVLFYSKQWIEAQKSCTEAMLRAQAEERKELIRSLTQIALETKDDQIRQQMFSSIMMFAMSVSRQ